MRTSLVTSRSIHVYLQKSKDDSKPPGDLYGAEKELLDLLQSKFSDDQLSLQQLGMTTFNSDSAAANVHASKPNSITLSSQRNSPRAGLVCQRAASELDSVMEFGLSDACPARQQLASRSQTSSRAGRTPAANRSGTRFELEPVCGRSKTAGRKPSRVLVRQLDSIMEFGLYGVRSRCTTALMTDVVGFQAHLTRTCHQRFFSERECCQPNFAALNRGRHLYSAGRPTRWALAHILVIFVLLCQFVSHSAISFYSARNARIASAVLATAIPSVCSSVRLSVCLSVTRRYCVKTTARSTVQFAPLDRNQKIFPRDDTFPLKCWLKVTYPLLKAASFHTFALQRLNRKRQKKKFNYA